jgi:glycosyltransferase involved in cell wall biosynthesis
VKGTSVSPVLPAVATAERAQTRGKRVGILVVTYNAVTTLARVLKRIPEPVWKNVEEILVFDDASQDATYELAVGLQTLAGDQKLHVLKHPKNLGYGGNQKAGYRHFIEKGFDAVVLLHGDGQYAPEVLAEMYAPLLAGEADAVFGSRMMPDFGGPLKGGMPLYKYVGNRVLTYFENRALGLNLTEWHSGYRAYSVEALRQIDFSHMTDDFHFDTEIIVKLHHQGFRIREVPIPTFYGDEICYVNGMRYARDILRSVYRYDRTRRSIRCFPEYGEYFTACPVAHAAGSSHDLACRAVGTAQKVLEYTNGDPSFRAELEGAGNHVVSRPVVESGAAQSLGALERAVRGESFTRILMLDTLAHTAVPEQILHEAREMLAPNGRLVVSLPNVANITVRLALLFGRFEYADRGIPDRTHLRFYTPGTARRLVESAGFEIVECWATPLPAEMVIGSPRWAVRSAQRFFAAAARIWPSLFAYQTFLVARRRR